jgi:hypothetical protein
MVDWSLEDLQKKERKRRAEVEMVKPERKREDLETSGPRVTCRFFFFFLSVIQLLVIILPTPNGA